MPSVLEVRVQHDDLLALAAVVAFQVGFRSAHLDVHVAKLSFQDNDLHVVVLAVLLVGARNVWRVRRPLQTDAAAFPSKDLAVLGVIDRHTQQRCTDVEDSHDCHGLLRRPKRPETLRCRLQAELCRRCRQ